MVDNLNNVAGNVSTLANTNQYDLTGYTSPQITFKVAYQQKGGTSSDKLQLYTSTNCGLSWIPRWAKFGAALATTTITSASQYMPAPGEFVTYTVSLSTLSGNNAVLFRWVFTADATNPGNDLYLDDINISSQGPLGISTLTGLNDLLIYPNPSSGQVNLQINLSEKHNVSLNVTDVLGRQVEHQDVKLLESGQNNMNVNSRNNYEAGIYFINLNIDGEMLTKKVIIR
jgi:hypothetical protein